MYVRPFHHAPKRRHSLSPPRPAVTLITLGPGLLDIAQLLLDLQHLGAITHVLAHVIAQLDSWAAVGSGDLDDDVEGLRLLAVGFVCEVIWAALAQPDLVKDVVCSIQLGGWSTLTRKESPHAKCWIESGFFGNCLVLQTILDIQRVREDNRLLIGDAFAVVKFAHHLDKVGRVARVLADTGVDLGVCLGGARMVGLYFICDGRRRGSIALHWSCADGFAEGVEEGRCAEGIGEGNSKDLYAFVSPYLLRILPRPDKNLHPRQNIQANTAAPTHWHSHSPP